MRGDPTMILLEAVQKALDVIEHSARAAEALRALAELTKDQDTGLSVEATLLAGEIEQREDVLLALLRQTARLS